MHRLVQEVIREELGVDGRSEMLERLHGAVDVCFPDEPQAPGSWPAGARWLPHVGALLERWRTASKTPDWDPTDLWNRVAWYGWASGRSGAVQEILEEQLLVRRRVLGEEHPGTLSSMRFLATTLRAQGDAGGARGLQEQALEVCRRVLGEEHPDTLTSMNDLAETRRALGDAQGARQLHEAELEVCRRVPDLLPMRLGLGALSLPGGWRRRPATP